MALIVRIDVDRPYGKHPAHRHLLSRFSSDIFFPKIEALGYLEELKWMLRTLNEHQARAYVFFRRCTLPSVAVLKLIDRGQHEIGLHLENSRSYASFQAERVTLEAHIERPVWAFSKHGSGGKKYGYHHYAPYEPDRYVQWGQRAGLKLFLGNLEDPALDPVMMDQGFRSFPAAFWLEPHWRDTNKFTIDWLISHAQTRDTVLLVHPENVLENPELAKSFVKLLAVVATKILP